MKLQVQSREDFMEKGKRCDSDHGPRNYEADAISLRHLKLFLYIDTFNTILMCGLSSVPQMD